MSKSLEIFLAALYLRARAFGYRILPIRARSMFLFNAGNWAPKSGGINLLKQRCTFVGGGETTKTTLAL